MLSFKKLYFLLFSCDFLKKAEELMIKSKPEAKSSESMLEFIFYTDVGETAPSDG